MSGPSASIVTAPAPATVAAGSTAADGATTASVPVLLRTTHASLAIPLAPYMVPVSWRRSHLSTLVNRILSPTTPTPLDFIVDGQLLRTSLAEYLESAGKDAESTLDLLYVPSTLPPKYEGAFEHDDWVASVDARGAAAFFPAGRSSSSAALLLTASYDGAIRVWSHANVEEPLLTYNTSSSAAGSLNPSLVDAVWTSSSDQGSAHFATAGMDGVIRAWSVPTAALQSHNPANGAANGASANVGKPRPLWTGPASLTSSPLSSLHTTTDGDHILAAAWDGTVSLWAANPSANDEANAASAYFVGQPDPEDEDEDVEDDDNEDNADAGAKRSAHRKKRRTLARTKAAASALTREPLQVMSHVAITSSLGVLSSAATTRVAGPNSKVARAIFANDVASNASGQWTAFSSGWDGAVKEWDLTVGGRSVASKSCDKVLLTMDQLQGASSTSTILLTGHMDRSSAIWDMRSDVATPTLVLPGAHSGPVSVLRTHPTNGNLFATGSHDGSLKLWDTRSPRTALFALARPAAAPTSKSAAGAASTKSKVLAMDWDASGKMLFSGGDDCRLSVHRGEGMDRTGEVTGTMSVGGSKMDVDPVK
ncbi:unnamed protein product [Tilletia controversa]|uniref:Ribosome biogenesis protein YTM1 n=3 Tax=Tilletia TaxID=13289 RepID=A0A8X7MYN9_9BASI|nr:hypothetical protein CF336_g946 [Tilletia laevis]KAE8204392.1 hypothetical protein CF328_g1106 [Tilletia controversa]KAE8264543.1 hypothetical protein A4X03_0g871 [Tilletia caries]KAE8207682.1 hypothetical protein CF335_g974 [Tilletia laevis]KAE8253798.1 hypothetical protein A4X06_0g1211 [Tilletia controversa]